MGHWKRVTFPLISTARFCRRQARRQRLSNCRAAAPIEIFHFHADFATPANSTFTLFASPAAAGFTQFCSRHARAFRKAALLNRLDGIGDRLMFRLAYRNFGDHESVVGNYTVSSGSVAGDSLV